MRAFAVLGILLAPLLLNTDLDADGFVLLVPVSKASNPSSSDAVREAARNGTGATLLLYTGVGGNQRGGRLPSPRDDSQIRFVTGRWAGCYKYVRHRTAGSGPSGRFLSLSPLVAAGRLAPGSGRAPALTAVYGMDAATMIR